MSFPFYIAHCTEVSAVSSGPFFAARCSEFRELRKPRILLFAFIFFPPHWTTHGTPPPHTPAPARPCLGRAGRPSDTCPSRPLQTPSSLTPHSCVLCTKLRPSPIFFCASSSLLLSPSHGFSWLASTALFTTSCNLHCRVRSAYSPPWLLSFLPTRSTSGLPLRLL